MRYDTPKTAIMKSNINYDPGRIAVSTSRKKSKSLSSLAGKGFHVLDQVLTSVGSVADTVNKVAPGIVDETSKVIDYHLDKHKDDFRIPSLIDLPLDEAERVLHLYNLEHSLILAAPDPKYANARPNIILAMAPKANSKVSPQTYVRAYYVDDAVIEASRTILDQQEATKARNRNDTINSRQTQVSKLTDNVKSISLGAGKLVKMISLRKPSDATANDAAEMEPAADVDAVEQTEQQDRPTSQGQQ